MNKTFVNSVINSISSKQLWSTLIKYVIFVSGPVFSQEEISRLKIHVQCEKINQVDFQDCICFAYFIYISKKTLRLVNILDMLTD